MSEQEKNPFGHLIVYNGEVMIVGQYHSHYHSEEGGAVRLEAVRKARETGGCWPWCGGKCCERIRAWLDENRERYQGKPRDRS